VIRDAPSRIDADLLVRAGDGGRHAHQDDVREIAGQRQHAPVGGAGQALGVPVDGRRPVRAGDEVHLYPWAVETGGVVVQRFKVVSVDGCRGCGKQAVHVRSLAFAELAGAVGCHM